MTTLLIALGIALALIALAGATIWWLVLRTFNEITSQALYFDAARAIPVLTVIGGGES